MIIVTSSSPADQPSIDMCSITAAHSIMITPPLDEWSPARQIEIPELDMATKYGPLSNFPTPPLSLEEAEITPRRTLTDHKFERLEAPARYISRLIPQGASRKPLAAEVIQAYLHRCDLPMSTIALAACIIDSLSSFFVRTWRKDLTVAATTAQSIGSQPRATSSPGRHSRLAASFGITPRPELIVLAALSIAKSFLDDRRGDCRWWAECIADGEAGAAELNTTIQTVLRDLNYDLMSFTPETIEDMRLEVFEVEAPSLSGMALPCNDLNMQQAPLDCVAT